MSATMCHPMARSQATAMQRRCRGGAAAASARPSAVKVMAVMSRPGSGARHSTAAGNMMSSSLRPGNASLRAMMAAAAVPSASHRRSAGRVSAVAVQANLFNRLSRIVRAFIDNIVTPFEEPEKLLDRVVQDMQEDIIKLRQASAQVVASQRQMQAKRDNLQSTADQWLRRAELAVKQGEDELAREALRRRKIFQDDGDRMGSQIAQQAKAAEQLQANLRVLESKVSEARSKKETLKARAVSARTTQQVQEMIGGLRLSSDSSWSAFEKMEEKVVAMEAQAEAVGQMAAPDNLERRFAMLEGSNGVEDELRVLKQARGGNNNGNNNNNNNGGGRLLADVFEPSIDKELEELRRRARM